MENKILPLVTIAVPAYNAGKTIGAMIESVLVQTYTNWELLIVDDGSSDNTAEVVRSFSDSRIRLICDGTNRKIAPRLNQLIDEAKGEFFARMDADDRMLPDRIERQVAFLIAHPEVDVVGGGAIVVDEGGNVLGGRNIVSEVATVNSFIHPTVAGRIEWFRKWRYDERFNGCEDSELWRRARRESVYRLLPGAVIYYKDSLSFNLKQYLFRQKQGARVALLGSGISLRERGKLFAGVILRSVIAVGVVCLGVSSVWVKRRNCSIKTK